MQRIMKWLGTGFVLSTVLSACSHKESAFDRATTVDVCAMVDQAAVERIVGRLSGPPQAGAADHGGGFAGECTWSFKSASSNSAFTSGDGTVHVGLSTLGAHSGIQGVDPWSKANLDELEASIGPRREVQGIGDRALLFEARGVLFSEIWVQQGKSYVVIRMMGASSSKLVDFARIVAGDTAARQANPTAADVAAGSAASASGG